MGHQVSGYRKPLDITPIEFKHVAKTRMPKREPKSTVPFASYPFIAWDGEATVDGGYCLLGTSSGEEICAPHLSTVEMLDFIMETGLKHRRSFHIGYVFDYDVNNILKDLPWQALILLKERSRCVWKDYAIEHVPGKTFVVRKNKHRVRIEDIFTFFRLPYCTGDSNNPGALDKYNIGSEELRKQIGEGKGKRNDFHWKDIDYIRRYFRLELQTMPQLQEKVREACTAAGMYVRSWYGPGALAKFELNKHKMQVHLAKTPDAMQVPVRTAYAGGWFERFKCGMYLGPVYTADLNSAYAWAMSLLPSLASGEWQYIEGEDAREYTGQFGIFNIRYGQSGDRRWNDFMRTCRGIPLPLFQRGCHGDISRPFHTTGWWWNFEARNVFRDTNVEFLGAWIFQGNSSTPFDWIEGAFDARAVLKAAGDPAEKAIKWMLASLYGTTAQRSGWNRRKRIPPRWHQLEYAGAITSLCRSMMYQAAMPVALRDGLISIDTDGITSTVPITKLPLSGEGDGLGEWKLEEFSGIIYFQNGIYWLRNMDGEWEPPKSRGIPRGKLGTAERAIEALRDNDGELTLTRHNFVGYGAALHRKERAVWRTWEDSQYNISIHFSGSRQHSKKLCRACNKGMGLHEGLHDLALSPPKDTESSPHKLPWIEPSDDDELKELIRHEIGSEYV
jgi:hypothetical protein